MDFFLGEIRMFAIGYAPVGWLECAGQVMQISQNQALYSLLSNYYGGDGRTTFALPDLRSRAPIALAKGGKLGQQAGALTATATATGTVLVSSANLPDHTHRVALPCSSSGSGSNDPTGAVFGNTGSGLYASPDGNTMATVTTDAAGSGSGGSTVVPFTAASTISTMQPSVAMIYCIATSGVYPSRP